MRTLGLVVLALALVFAASGAAAVRLGATDCAVDLGGASGAFGCKLTIPGGVLTTDGSPVVTVAVSGGTTARFRYDSADRLVASDVGGQVTSYSYDEAGRLAARIDADGQATRYTYDSLGRLVGADDWAFAYSDLGLVRAATSAGSVVDYTYDADRHVLSASQDGAVERFAYDRNGRIVHAEGSGGTIDYQYDDGELVRRVDGGLTTVEFSYDQHGRLVESSAARGETTRFKYANSDSLQRVSDGSGVTRFSYDRSGRLTAIVNPDGSSTGFGYDTAGHLLVIVPGIDDEVVVDFEEGDPDRPLVIGGVYSHKKAPVYALTLTGSLRTCSRCP